MRTEITSQGCCRVPTHCGEACVKQLIHDQRLDCPECRAKHDAKNEGKSFPQKKYLLVQIRKKKANTKEDQPVLDQCKKHGKELALYCLEDVCQMPICVSCLKTDHKGHEFTEIEEHTKEVLIRDVKTILNNLEAKVEMISKAKKDVFEKTDKCMNELNKTKHVLLECIITQFDIMIEETQLLRDETNLLADRELSAMRANIELLSSNLENSEGCTDYEKMKNYHETVKRIIENNRENLSGARSFQFPVFTEGRFSAEMLGRVTTGEITLVLPDHEHHQTCSSDPDPVGATGKLSQQ